jgi:hypothetical protein
MGVAKARIVNDEPESNPEVERMADLNESEGGELFRAIEEARSTQGAEVILTRTMPADKAGFCDKIPVAEFDLSLLKTRYGPGTYRVRFNGPTGFLPGGSTIKVAPSPDKSTAAGGGATDLSSLLELMERRDAERRARTDDWMKLGITALGPVLAAWVSRSSQGTDVAALASALKPAPGPSLADLSQVMVNMRSMTEPKGTESNVDTILRVFEAAQGMMGGEKEGSGGTQSNWIDIVRDLIKSAPEAIKPILQAKMGAMMQAQRAAAPVTQVQPQIPNPVQKVTPVPVNPIPPDQPEATQGDNNVNMLMFMMPAIRANLEKVVGWAEKDRDPSIYADVLVDELPDNFGNYIPFPKLFEYLNHPQWFEEICKIEPRLQPHREWCDECRQCIEQIFRDMQSGVEEPDAPEVSETAPKVNGSATEVQTE